MPSNTSPRPLDLDQERRCGATSEQGLTCGRPKGHRGNHNALWWGVPITEPPRPSNKREPE